MPDPSVVIGPVPARDERTARGIRAAQSGLDFLVDVHVQARPDLSLRDAHALSGTVKHAIRFAVPAVSSVLIRRQPFETREPHWTE